ncbi:MAG: PorV/PorQ family protein [Elusimicrobiota bacterium]
MISAKALMLGTATALITANGITAHAFGSSEKGTSGAAFLKIGPGARPAAMGEAFSAVEGDVHSLYYNPAGLAAVKGWDMTGMHDAYFQGMSYDFIAAAVPLSRMIGRDPSERLGVLGMGIYSLSVGDIERRGRTDASGPSGTFGAQDMAFALGYAREVRERLSAGGSAKFIRQTLDDKSASAMALDAGAVFRASERLNLSAGWRHLGTRPSYGGPADPLPLTLYLGSAFKPRPELGLSLDLAFPRDRGVSYSLGAEFVRPMSETLAASLRAGYAERNTDADGLGGVAMGAGLKYKSFDFDFAWVPLGDLGNTFRYSFRLRY